MDWGLIGDVFGLFMSLVIALLTFIFGLLWISNYFDQRSKGGSKGQRHE